jgi:hypothetical protein
MPLGDALLRVWPGSAAAASAALSTALRMSPPLTS